MEEEEEGQSHGWLWGFCLFRGGGQRSAHTLSPGGPTGPAAPGSPRAPLLPSSPAGPGGP